MARRTGALLIAAVAAGAALIPAAGASAGTLDQQQTVSSGSGQFFNPGTSKAQTFTAGRTGQLDQVDLALSGMSLTQALTVQIHDASASGPGSTVLATASVPTSGAPSTESFVPITFTSPATVTAGTQYAIVAFSDVGWVWYQGGAVPNSPYAGGKPYSSPDDEGPGSGPWFEGAATADFQFKTYVVEPTGTGNPPPTTNPPTPKKKKCKKKKAKKGAAPAKKKKCKKKK